MNRVLTTLKEEDGWQRSGAASFSLNSDDVLNIDAPSSDEGRVYQEYFPVVQGDKIKLKVFARKVSGADGHITIRTGGDPPPENVSIRVTSTEWQEYVISTVAVPGMTRCSVDIEADSNNDSEIEFHTPKFILPDYPVFKGVSFTPELNFDDVDYTNQQGYALYDGNGFLEVYFLIDVSQVNTPGTGSLAITENTLPFSIQAIGGITNFFAGGSIRRAVNIPTPSGAKDQIFVYAQKGEGILFEFNSDTFSRNLEKDQFSSGDDLKIHGTVKYPINVDDINS